MAIERIANTDFKSLHELKRESRQDSKKALPQVAKQFEGLFLQSLLKTMRMSSHFVDEKSPFRGRNAETFQEMLDGQYVDKMIKSPSGIGIAEMLTKQLGGKIDKTKTPTEIGQIAHQYTIPKGDALKINNAKTELAPKEAESTSSTMIENFVSSIWSKAKQAAASMGLDPKMLIAQAALETGWGQSVAKDSDGSSSNNLFNIKSGSNSDFASVKIKTTEYIADTPIKVSASFRKYESVEDSFNDYVALIKNNNRYQSALDHAGNPERYVNELSKAGYATDPNYGSKILSIYHSQELNEAMKKCELAEPV
ncbi:flagellar assembly peptidoglycan hydrolase FlgJ [Legionella sp. km772]|uniref:flagellar assembly peptidoglycan hydrolase FlgJ n=1 Tax=Legionella sp. km772 TaxID=2498111 RepID=UPI000F8C5AC6|nr:flagellar assembly peptidoglycan hydrolase FlgJ [Legionella sp. km772]RUR08864.1 flagellar assembly peptidoglycan hydrolase FlgJ [Legionella sp. km772]